MQFTYKIENYFPSENRLFVVYQPADETLPPFGNWVPISTGMTEEAIHERIISAVPYSKWTTPADPIAQQLVGFTSSTVAHEPVAPEVDLSSTIRNIRSGLLVQSDWTQLPDAPITEEQKTAWATYRQALRDVTTQEGFPNSVTWPETP